MPRWFGGSSPVSSPIVGASKLLAEPRGPITVVTLNRPEVHNCIDAETAGLLAEAIRAFAADGSARVLVVTGAGGRAFCSGADLNDLEGVMARATRGHGAPLGFADLEPGKPRIAAVEGWCIAGGIELACWCDLAVAGDGALFGALAVWRRSLKPGMILHAWTDVFSGIFARRGA